MLLALHRRRLSSDAWLEIGLRTGQHRVIRREKVRAKAKQVTKRETLFADYFNKALAHTVTNANSSTNDGEGETGRHVLLLVLSPF